jgi:hypothetical protein
MNSEIEISANTKFIAILEFQVLGNFVIEVAGNFCMMERTEIKGWHYYYGDQLLDLCT